MTAAGYSGRSAADKLGVRRGTRLALLDAPEGWTLGGLPEDVAIRRDLRGRRDVTVVFVRSRRDLERDAPRYERSLADDASLWIAWPRAAAGHASDVSENLLREVFLPRGLVDVKVAAIDRDWSGLKFVRRKRHRAHGGGRKGDG
ncbi:MAG TPA: hypothetical protein VHF25_03310 [Nitriliruptorales bacterium]|nr:hypothetical protein [Nitriliruptorales bacterium]